MYKKKKLTVADFYKVQGKKLDLQLVSGAGGLEREIHVPELNRPGIALAGYFNYFAKERIQALGKVEIMFLKTLPPDLRKERLGLLLNLSVPCVIIGRRYKAPVELLDLANIRNIPIFRSSLVTMNVINMATNFLETVFAPEMTVHGVLVEVFGIGVLIQGASAVGKSESALGLIVRGHRLVSDDLVCLRLVGSNRIVGACHKLGQHRMEFRGLGIIDIQSLFGAARIMESRDIDISITLEERKAEKEYDRIGIDENTTEIFGIEIPHIVLPVKPGRDMALLVEVAALNHRLKQQGHNSGLEFQNQILKKIENKLD